jgi:hypothetical protein
MLLSVWRNHPVRLPSEPEPPRVLAVQIRPLPPQPRPIPAAPHERVLPRPHERARHTAPAGTMPQRAEAATPRAIVPETSPTPERPTPAETPARHGAAPHFDVGAARNFARRIANDPDPAKAGTAVAQFPDESYHPHTRLERAIGAAKRGNCKDGLPGGLLAPLYLMLDKKDSGCKW